MPRNLLVQWTAKTILGEDASGSHGRDLHGIASSKERLTEPESGDRIFVAGVIGGQLLPVCRLVVARVATQVDLLEAEGGYDLPFHAVAGDPLPRMNLRHRMTLAESRRVETIHRGGLARQRHRPERIS